MVPTTLEELCKRIHIVALRFGDHGTQEILRIVDSKCTHKEIFSANKIFIYTYILSQQLPKFLLFRNRRSVPQESLISFKLWPTTSQQDAPTCNRVCKQTQHVTPNNVGTMLANMEQGLQTDATCNTQQCWNNVGQHVCVRLHVTLTRNIEVRKAYDQETEIGFGSCGFFPNLFAFKYQTLTDRAFIKSDSATFDPQE